RSHRPRTQPLCPRRVPHSAATATDSFASTRAFLLAAQLTGRPACAREAAACDYTIASPWKCRNDQAMLHYRTAAADRLLAWIAPWCSEYCETGGARGPRTFQKPPLLRKGQKN